jgi:2-iminobutanoate/2-iminopropanoate deaminase
MKRIIKSSKAPAPIGPYSQAIVIGDTLYTSGQIAINPATNQLEIDDIHQETKLVMENLKALLIEAEMDFTHVIKCSIFISNMENFGHINEVYSTYFSSDFPVRETVEVSCLPKNVNVEISLIAVK